MVEFMPVYVDAIIFRFYRDELQVRLAKRSDSNKRLPGVTALEGVIIKPQQDANEREALNRLFIEKIGLTPTYVEQLPASANATRDTDGYSCCIPFLVLVESSLNDEHGIWQPVDDFLTADDSALPFDHVRLIKMAFEVLYNKSGYTDIPLKLLEQPFRFSDIRKSFKAVLKTDLNRMTIKRRILPILKTIEGADKSKRDAPIYVRAKPDLFYFKNANNV